MHPEFSLLHLSQWNLKYLENILGNMLINMNHLIKQINYNDFTSQIMRVLYNESIHQNESDFLLQHVRKSCFVPTVTTTFHVNR